MTTCRISKEVEFDAGHRVPSHAGKCRSPHGHRYRLRVLCTGPIIDDPSRSDDGMLVDFGDLKALMNEYVADPLDHAMVIWEKDAPLMYAMDHNTQDWKIVVFPYVPTAENLARWAWEQLGPQITARFGEDLCLTEVAVWETPTSVAYYNGWA
jgi:6-pyruvoyltetrahydropterin/6-carboxytetrahydropterin synthase